MYDQSMIANPTSTGGLTLTTHAPPKTVFLNVSLDLMHRKAYALGPLTDKHWKHICEPIFKENCDKIEDEGKSRRVTLLHPPPCWQALVCLCHGDGPDIHAMRWHFFMWIKSLCPPKSVNRELLSHRRVVVEIHQWQVPTDAASPFAIEMDRIRGYGGVEAVDSKVFLHVGNPSFSPWGATFKRLKLAPEQHPQEVGEVELVGLRRWNCKSLWQIPHHQNENTKHC